MTVYETNIHEFVGDTKSTLRNVQSNFERLEECQKSDRDKLFNVISNHKDEFRRMMDELSKELNCKCNALDKRNMELDQKINQLETLVKVNFTKIFAWAAGAGFATTTLMWLVKHLLGKI